MGRNVSNTTTTKAVITENVPTTFTTAYNNTTGAGAELTSININGTGDSTVFGTSTGAEEWSYFGSTTIPAIQEGGTSSRGFGIPYPVQLSDDRVLMFQLPHYQHRGGDADFMGGETIHCQIVEFDTGRFKAGPITTHNLPSTVFSSSSYSFWSQPNNISGSYNQPMFRAVALTPTKVVAAYRMGSEFRLMRFTITGNTVNRSVESIDLTGATYFNTTTAGAFAINKVPDAPDQCIIGGYASSNWSMQAYSIPDTGGLSSLTSLTSTTITVSTYHFGMAPMVKEATTNQVPYIIAGAFDSNSAQAVIFTYNSSAQSFTQQGSAVNLTDSSGSWAGIQCECLSTGTNANAVIATIGTSTANTMSFYRQTSATVVANSVTNLTLQHTTTKSIQESYRWGDERAVFVGDAGMLTVFDSAGVATNLLTDDQTTDTNRWQGQWYPFNSRPIYSIYDQGSRIIDRACQWHTRINVADATDVGDVGYEGTYLPMFHDRGMCYAWNEAASCWIVAQHGRLYAMDTDGNILSEQKLYDLDYRLNWQYRIADLDCSPSGKIFFATVRYLGALSSSTYVPNNSFGGYTTGNYLCVTEPLTDGTKLGSLTLANTPANYNTYLTCNLTAFVEQTDETTRTERAFCFGFYNSSPQGYIYEFDGTQWNAENTTAISTTSNTTQHRGWHVNFKMIQDTPCSVAYPSGMWRIVGSYAFNSTNNHRRIGISNKYEEGQFGNFNTTQNAINSTLNDDSGYGIQLYKYTSGNRSSISVATQYDPVIGKTRIWSSIDGRLNYTFGYTGSDNHADFTHAQVAVSKFAYAVAYQNTSFLQKQAKIDVFNKTEIDAPEATLTSGLGAGWITLKPIDKTTFQVFGDSIDTIYKVSGIPDTVKFFLLMSDGAGTEFYLNNGQVLDLASEDTGLFRATDVYYIPPGYNLQIRCNTENTISTLMSIKEYI